MSLIKIGMASIRYHKRTMSLYSLFLLISFFALFIVNSLEEILPVLLAKTEDLLYSSGFQSEKQVVIQQLKQTSSQAQLIYDFFKIRVYLFTVLGLALFYLIYQRVKQKDYFAWKQAGSSNKSWFTYNLVELALPFLLLLIGFVLFFLLFQHVFSHYLLSKHLNTLAQIEITKKSLTISGDSNLNQLVMRVPSNNQAWISSLSLTSYEWSKLLLSSFWQTIKAFLTMIFSIGSLIILLTIIRGNRLWKNRP